jgi:hypothetical protein
MTGSNPMAGQGVRSGNGSCRAGIAVAAVTSFLIVWVTIVRDDGQGAGSFMVILAVAVGWFAAGFRAAGMARTMLGVAVMQAMMGMLIATAPVVANVPGESLRSLLFSGVFAALWLVSGAFFRAAARGERSKSAIAP